MSTSDQSTSDQPTSDPSTSDPSTSGPSTSDALVADRVATDGSTHRSGNGAEGSVGGDTAEDTEASAATEPIAGTASPAGEPVRDTVSTVVELSPGDVPTDPVAALWPADAVTGLRERWRDLQLRFVDDPHSAAAEADVLVGEAVETLTGSLAALRTDLSGWRGAGGADTEQLRVAVQRYREFLGRILDLRPAGR